jgi:hypothetical protein
MSRGKNKVSSSLGSNDRVTATSPDFHANCSRKADGRQLPKTMFRLSDHFQIRWLENVSSVAGVIHNELGSHVSAPLRCKPPPQLY